MAASHLGAVSLGDFVVGIKATVDVLVAAIIDLKAKLELGLTAIADLKVAFDLALQALVDFEAALELAIDASIALAASIHAKIKLLALADLQFQLNAALAIVAQLKISVTDPALYLSGLISGNLQVQANLNVLLPQIALSAQLDASLALALQLEAKIIAITLAIDLLLSIPLKLKAELQVALKLLINAFASVRVALDLVVSLFAEVSLALQAMLPPLALALDLQAKFALGTGQAYLFDGQLQDMGDQIDTLVTGGATGGLLLTESVRAWLLVVPASAVPLYNAATALLKSV